MMEALVLLMTGALIPVVAFLYKSLKDERHKRINRDEELKNQFLRHVEAYKKQLAHDHTQNRERFASVHDRINKLSKPTTTPAEPLERS